MKIYLIFAALFLFAMCTSDKKVYVSTFQSHYDNGKSIEVVRTDEHTEWRGMLTGIDYGGYNDFYYKFMIQPDECAWEGYMDEVPLELTFCADDIYLKVTKRMIKYDSLYSEARFKDTTLYYRNVDDRYLFKLFGKQYFDDIDSITYHSLEAGCLRVPVPYL